jgi:beta-lactamase class D
MENNKRQSENEILNDFANWYDKTYSGNLTGEIIDEYVELMGHLNNYIPSGESKSEWLQIEQDFIEWDNKTHSNASQRQILDWFKERFNTIQSEPINQKLLDALRELTVRSRIYLPTDEQEEEWYNKGLPGCSDLYGKIGTLLGY